MKLSRIRVSFQVILHLLLAGHVLAYYFLDWKVIGALDFQTFFHYLLGDGLITAGALLTVVVYGTALIFGRLFCSWGCHFGATQDLAAWILKRLGWKPPLLRARLLTLLPYAVLAVVFLLPLVERWSASGWRLRRPDLAAVPPWDTLPGWIGSAVTFLACGVGLLLFLGTRGFCRFVCPYGALFRITDRAALYRVRRTGPCSSQCGSGGTHACTAACPTAIDVHEETARWGQVVSADCVRCNLCIEACPSKALSHATRGAARALIEAAAAVPAAPLPPAFRPIGLPVRAAPLPLETPGRLEGDRDAARRRYDLPLWGEIVVVLVAAGAYGAADLVYGGHFLAAAIGLGEGFLALQAIRVVAGDPLAKVLGRPLRAGRGWTLAGITLLGCFALSLIPLFEAGAFKWLRRQGRLLDPAAAAALSSTAGSGLPLLTPPGRSRLEAAADRYRRALEYFPSDAGTRRLLLSAYVRLGDPRALDEADVYSRLSNDPEGRDLRDWVRRRFGKGASGQDRSP